MKDSLWFQILLIMETVSPRCHCWDSPGYSARQMELRRQNMVDAVLVE